MLTENSLGNLTAWLLPDLNTRVVAVIASFPGIKSWFLKDDTRNGSICVYTTKDIHMSVLSINDLLYQQATAAGTKSTPGLTSLLRVRSRPRLYPCICPQATGPSCRYRVEKLPAALLGRIHMPSRDDAGDGTGKLTAA